MIGFRRHLTWFATAVLLTIFSWSIWQPGFFLVHDYTHIARAAEYWRAWQGGHFPVLWTSNFGAGYGMPLFLFYGPLPFFLMACLIGLGFTGLTALKLVYTLSGVLAFGGMYGWLRPRGRSVALLAATLALGMPYRAVDLYVRGALSEALAIGLLPWIGWGLYEITSSHTRRQGIIRTTLATAALVLTHNLTALIGIPFLAATVSLPHLFSQEKWSRKQVALLTQIGALAWGGSLSLFFSVPALLEKNSTQLDSILTGYFDYHLHFLYIRQLLWPRWGYGGSEFGPNDGMSFHLGWPLFLWLAIALCTIGELLLHSRHNNTLLTKFFAKFQPKNTAIQPLLQIVVVATLFGLSLFLTTFKSQSIWETSGVLGILQFPWRFLAVAGILGAFLAAVTSAHLSQWQRWFLVALTVVFVIAGQGPLHRPEQRLLDPENRQYDSHPDFIRRETSKILPDYLPKDFTLPETPLSPSERIVVNGATTTRWERNDSHELLLYAEAPAQSQVQWNIADFAGWQYYINGKQVWPQKTPTGTVLYTSPEKVEYVSARFGSTPLRSSMLLISTISAILFLSYVFAQNVKRNQVA